jgi:hypothetical protein
MSSDAGSGKNRSIAPIAEIKGLQNDAIGTNYDFDIWG